MDNKKILLELINAHRRENRRTYIPALLIIIPLTLISIGGFIYCLYNYVKSISFYYSDSYKIGSWIMSSVAMILFIILCICLWMRSSNNRDINIFSNENTEALIW
jgi:polyferredoxin